MWVRSVLPPVPPCQRSAPGVESKATTLAAASSLLISLHQKSLTSLHPGILTMRNPCLLRSTRHVLLQSLGLGSMGGGTAAAARFCSLADCALVNSTSPAGLAGMEMPFDGENAIGSPHLLRPALSPSPRKTDNCTDLGSASPVVAENGTIEGVQ